MNPLMLRLGRDLRQGKISIRADRLQAADLVRHLIAAGATKPEADAAVRDFLTRMTEHRARQTAPAGPTCPRCGRGAVPEKVYDDEDPELMVLWRCLRCGKAEGAVS